jgi:hypothetical protein
MQFSPARSFINHFFDDQPKGGFSYLGIFAERQVSNESGDIGARPSLHH